MTNFRLFILAVVVVLSVALGTIYFHKFIKDPNLSEKSYKPGIYGDIDKAVNQAEVVYQQAKSLGTDFSAGPCLSNALLPDWVLDIAHNPRLAIDDLSANQCSALKEGKANHFVELDPNGKLIKVK